MKNINTSIFDFPKLRDPVRDCVYVDKTAQLYELARPTSADWIFYLPRPRRFGKSLMISTLKALFQGRRELFDGLAIEQTGWDWKKEVYPVLHLDMSQVSSKNADELELNLKNLVKLHCSDLDLPFDPNLPASAVFANLLAGLKTKSADGRYVLLIDEYDAPITGFLDSPEGREELKNVRKTLHDFYVQAKSQCGNMRFLMVTGVTKFAKASIFSAFNNPCDLTLDARAADLLGYTHEEMEKYFHEHIQAFADKEGMSYDAMFAKLLDWYDSYQFSPRRLVKVMNPVSFGNALANQAFGNYWEATAGSTLIFEALQAVNKAPIDFATTINVKRLDAPDALTAPTAALLYQGGYLTIDQPVDFDRVLLKIPNHEVTDSLYDGYVAYLLGKEFEIDDMEGLARDTSRALLADGPGEKFFTFLRAGFSKLPHDWVAKDEKEAKRAFLAFIVFTGARLYGESQQALGRPDAIIENAKGVHIFEFKFNQSAEAALAQCREKNYAAPYADDPRPVWYIALNYNAEKRTLDEPLYEQVKPR